MLVQNRPRSGVGTDFGSYRCPFGVMMQKWQRVHRACCHLRKKTRKRCWVHLESVPKVEILCKTPGKIKLRLARAKTCKVGKTVLDPYSHIINVPSSVWNGFELTVSQVCEKQERPAGGKPSEQKLCGVFWNAQTVISQQKNK